MDLRSSFNSILWNHLMLKVEGKVGYVNLWDIKTTLDDSDFAKQSFFFTQINFGIGYIF